MTLLARPSRNAAARTAMAFALGAAALFMAPAAEARITRIVVDPALSQSPTFEGRVFGSGGNVGTYEKLRGKAYGELDPADPRNALSGSGRPREIDAKHRQSVREPRNARRLIGARVQETLFDRLPDNARRR